MNALDSRAVLRGGAKVSRQTLYGLRNHDPEFRRLWDEARDLGDLALEDEAYERSIIGGSDGMLKFVLQKRLPERWGDPPKTINQNLSLRLMSPEQREEEAGRILLRIAALGIPLISIDGEAIDISDLQAEAEAGGQPCGDAQKALNRPESPESPGFAYRRYARNGIRIFQTKGVSTVLARLRRGLTRPPRLALE